MCMNIVTIDFDWEEKTPLERALFTVKLQALRQWGIPFKVKRTRKGYHVYIGLKLPFWARIAWRAYLHDDDMRIEIDIIRHEAGLHHWEETLFNSKCQKEYCYVEREARTSSLL